MEILLFAKRYSQLCRILLGPGKRNVALFFFILIPNVISSLLEGVSFALLLGALSAFSGSFAPGLEKVMHFFRSFFPSLWEPSKHNFLFFALITAAVALQGIRSIVGGISLYANSLLSLRIQRQMQHEIYCKIFDLSYMCVSQYKVGDLAEYTKTPAVVMNTIMDSINRFCVSAFMIAVTLMMMFFLDSNLTFLTVGLLILAGCLHKSIINRIGRSSRKLSDSVVECTRDTVQVLHSIRTIHTYNKQGFYFEKISSILEDIIALSKKVFFWVNFIPSISELISIFLVSSILLFSIWIKPNMSEGFVPILLTFLALTHRLGMRLQIANGALGAIASHKGALLRLEEMLSDEGKEFVSQRGDFFPGFLKSIELVNVCLLYPASISMAVQNISLKIPKGKTVAFVGLSGAGKSSILDLLLRLYEPTSGYIRVDGVDLRQYTIGSWRDCLGVVSQDVAIFNDTLEENIRFGSPEKTKEQIVQAAQLAGVDDFVAGLPRGYQTVLGERGFRLSGGQRQRVALARALIREPKILILDEATSSLDSYSEMMIQNALSNFKRKTTILIVAHRLSTIMEADHIYVLEKGEIIEEGTHSRLVALGGTYRRLWDLQATSNEMVDELAADSASIQTLGK